jgi:hypothetical protein
MILPTIDPVIAAGRRPFDSRHRRCLRFLHGFRRRPATASWSSVWHLLAAFAVISYTSNWAYVLFAALGSLIGGYSSITLLKPPPARRA